MEMPTSPNKLCLIFPHKPCTYINIAPEHALIATSRKAALHIFTFAQMRARGEGRRVSLRKFAVPLLIKQSATCSWVTHSTETTFNSASARRRGECFPQVSSSA